MTNRRPAALFRMAARPSQFVPKPCGSDSFDYPDAVLSGVRMKVFNCATRVQVKPRGFLSFDFAI
jgi:hypothetical protein